MAMKCQQCGQYLATCTCSQVWGQKPKEEQP